LQPNTPKYVCSYRLLLNLFAINVIIIIIRMSEKSNAVEEVFQLGRVVDRVTAVVCHVTRVLPASTVHRYTVALPRGYQRLYWSWDCYHVSCGVEHQ